MGFSTLDYAVLAVYLVGITIFGSRFRRSHATVRDYFVGTRQTFPIYLYSALRFPNRLPEVLAVAVVVMLVSLVVVVGAEIGRRVAERRLGATT